MLGIESSAVIFCGERTLRVISSGEYNEQDLVELCYDEDEDNKSIGAAQAHYINYGYHLGDFNIQIVDEILNENGSNGSNGDTITDGENIN